MRNGKASILMTLAIVIILLTGFMAFAQELSDQQVQDLFASDQTAALSQIAEIAPSDEELMLATAEPRLATAEATLATAAPMMLVVGSGTWYNGYSGGCGGGQFLDSIPSDTKEVVGVIIRSGAYVDSLQMAVRLANGNVKLLGKHGGNGGGQSVFLLNSGEYITSIWGKYGAYVDSIQFRTNTGRTSPKYGGNGGCGNYYYQAPAGYEIAGFFGRSGAYVDAIGVVLKRH